MKLQAATQNVFSMNTALPLVGQWERGAARRARFTIRPFAFEDVQRTVSNRDELVRKQEMVCAIILSLCLLCTIVLCFAQLASL